MKTTTYLVVSDRGTVKAYNRTRPSTKPNEVCVEVKLEVPDQLFDRPSIQAEIVVPKSASGPVTLKAETISIIKDAVQGDLGDEVTVKLVDEQGL